MIAFLACRVLDSFEDIADSRQAVHAIGLAAAFLAGQSNRIPDAARLRATSPARIIDHAIVDQLPEIRVAIDTLAEGRRNRVLRLVKSVSEGMTESIEAGARRSLDRYGAAVLGSVAAYIMEFISHTAPDPADAASIGIVAQAANDLRDLSTDVVPGADKDEMALDLRLAVAEHAPRVLSALQRIAAGAPPRMRASITHLALTTTLFFARRSGYKVGGLLRYPGVAAFLARCSRLAQDLIFLEIVWLVGAIVCRTAAGRDPGETALHIRARPRRLQLWLERGIAALHPESGTGARLAHSAELVHLALMLSAALPDKPLARVPRDGAAGNVLMVSDYLLSCALDRLSGAGPHVLAEVGRSTANLALSLVTRPATDPAADTRGEIAALLARLAFGATDSSADAVELIAERFRTLSARFHQIDQSPRALLAAMLGGPGRIARALGRWRSDPPMTSMVPTGRS